MRILYLITARGGSKGIPGKNIRKIAGIPLVGFKAIAALQSKFCSRLVISTDSPEIRDVAIQYGAEAPFLRPAELATDGASSVDVIWHAMQWLEQESREHYDAVMLLEPSSPFTRPDDFNNAVAIMQQHGADVVVGMKKPEVNSVFVGPMDADGKIERIVSAVCELDKLQRQGLEPEYTMNGALYLFGWEFFKKHRAIYYSDGAIYGYLMDPHHSIEIDEMIDLHWAEYVVEQGYIDMTPWRQEFI